MFPWLMPNPMAGQLSLLQMYQQSPPHGGLFNSPSARDPYASRQPFQDRSDQNAARQPGATPATPWPSPGQQPQAEPAPVSPASAGANPGWGAPALQMLAPGPDRGLGGNNQRKADPRAGMQMGLLGLSMLQPRQPTHTGPYPWI